MKRRKIKREEKEKKRISCRDTVNEGVVMIINNGREREERRIEEKIKRA